MYLLQIHMMGQTAELTYKSREAAVRAQDSMRAAMNGKRCHRYTFIDVVDDYGFKLGINPAVILYFGCFDPATAIYVRELKKAHWEALEPKQPMGIGGNA
jgi:hypothetical protein